MHQIRFSDKAGMAIDALSQRDQARVLASIAHLENDEQQDWIRRNSHKLAQVRSLSGQTIWMLRAGKSLRILYSHLQDETTNEPFVAILDVAPRERIEKLLAHHGDNP